MTTPDGRVEAVYTCQQDSQGMWVQDLERGVMESLGEISLAMPGSYTLQAQPGAETWKAIGLKSVNLAPQ